ncbi:hypothetical protein [Microbacterium sp. LWO13-1.2]|uniref:hypothetical protein n=1 Tax=Microbacterium sp. LWO13-1.2 TaxID=3135262 RepID=UPI00313962BE
MSLQRDHQLDAEVDGAQLLVSFGLDLEEHQRRHKAGVAAVPDETLLAALLSIPEDRLGPVEPRFVHLFDDPATSAYATVIDDPDGNRWAQCTLRAPVSVSQIDAYADSWRGGLRLAHDWVGYAARVIHLSAIDDVGLPCIEAAEYGVGLVTDAGTLVTPSEYRPRRWTAARWRFAELVYDQFLNQAIPSAHT